MSEILHDSESSIFYTHSFDAMVVVGKDTILKKANPAFLRILGYSENELIGRSVFNFLHPEDVARIQGGIAQLSQGQSRLGTINRYRTSEGAYRSFSWNTRPLGDNFYSVGRDITDQLAAEAKIQKLNAELTAKNQNLEAAVAARMAELKRTEEQVQQLQKMDAIGRLAGGIAHDFNNLLGSISILCELAENNVQNPNEVLKHIGDIFRVTERATALTRQLLMFSRKNVTQAKPLALNPLILELKNMLVRLIGETIHIDCQLAQNLKNISADPSQMEQVLLNLVVNARDAMPSGGKMTISTANVFLDEHFASTHLGVPPGEYILLSVTDTGTGMDEQTKKKIFEPFFTTKPIGKGTGLGLATTYGIVKQSLGSIWVYSELGKGSVFKVYLPVVAAPEVTKPAETKAAAADFIQPYTVLLAEDDETLREGFIAILETKNFTVIAASNPAEAIQLSRDFGGKIDLLLTDMVMPGQSGIDLANSIRSARKDIRVIFMSGYASDVLKDSGIEDATNLDYIQKPFTSKSLFGKISEVMNRK